MFLEHDTFDRLCRARELLRVVTEGPRSIRDVARQAGMSPFHFIRQFEALFGITPHQFRIVSRLDHAKLLLAGGEHSVTEVCFEVGMSSLGSFSDLFARRIGTTPSDYRRHAPVGWSCKTKGTEMRIKLSSLMVNDQSRARTFYTEMLGFKKKHDIPMGEYNWLTVVSPEGPDDLELTLEPSANPAAKVFQEAMFAQSIPLTAFEVTDIDAECTKLKGLGVVFTTEPVPAGPVKIAVFSDTCGNLIQRYQKL